MRWFLIVNPGSHQSRGAKFVPVLRQALQSRHIDHELGFTTCLDDARLLSQEAVLKGFDAIVAVGGDGTINKVINGFYDTEGRRLSSAKLGVIHTGTSPDFCKNYGIPTAAPLALETLLRGKTRQISVARIEARGANKESQTGYFACCASFGVGARVAQRSNSGLRKYLGDRLGTLYSILCSLLAYKASDLRMICDGRELVVRDNFNTFVGKSAHIASGMKVRNTLAADDARLYVLSLKKLNGLNLIPALNAVYSGKVDQNRDYLSFTYARTVEILAGVRNNEIEYDGDPQAFLPCRICVAADKLELIANEL